MKTFTFTKITDRVYSSDRDEYDDYGEDIQYTASDSELASYIAKYLYEDYYAGVCEFRKIRANLIDMINQLDLVDTLADQYYDILREDLESEVIG